MHVHARPHRPGQLVDRRPAGLKIGDHLGRDLGWEGGDAARADAVVAGEHDHLRGGDARARIGAPAGIPDGQVLEPAKGGGRLGQLGIARLGPFAGGTVGAGGGGKLLAKVFEAVELGHGVAFR